MQQEEESKSPSKSGTNGTSNSSVHGSNPISADSSTRNYADESSDEEIVMDEDYSGDEAEELLHHHHHLQKS